MLWFAAQAAIDPGNNMKGRYYLVRNSSVFRVAEDPRGVFPVYDDFSGSQIDRELRVDVKQGSGNSQIQPIASGIRINVESSGLQLQSRGLQSRWTSSDNGILAQARMRVPSAVNRNCNELIPMAGEKKQ